jgi:hypothetical protein
MLQETEEGSVLQRSKSRLWRQPRGQLRSDQKDFEALSEVPQPGLSGVKPFVDRTMVYLAWRLHD